MKKIITVFSSLLFIIGIIVGAVYLYSEYKANEMAAFHYAKDFIITNYHESNNLSHGGTRYDVGRGNYFVIVQNQQQKNYYLEVKLDSDGYLASIEDNTSAVIDSEH